MDGGKAPFAADGRPQWTKAVERIERYWGVIVGGPAKECCVAVSVLCLGTLFVLALPWFVVVSLKKAIFP